MHITSKTVKTQISELRMRTVQSSAPGFLAAFFASWLRIRWRAMSTIGRSFFWSYSPGGSTIDSCRKPLMPSSMSLRLSAMYAISWNLYMTKRDTVQKLAHREHLFWLQQTLCWEELITFWKLTFNNAASASFSKPGKWPITNFAEYTDSVRHSILHEDA